MKKYIVLLVLIILCMNNVYGQMTQFFQQGQTYEQWLEHELTKKSIFGDLGKATWLDQSVLVVLQYFDGLHYFFGKQVRIIAEICLVLSLGIGAVEL